MIVALNWSPSDHGMTKVNALTVADRRVPELASMVFARAVASTVLPDRTDEGHLTSKCDRNEEESVGEVHSKY